MAISSPLPCVRTAGFAGFFPLSPCALLLALRPHGGVRWLSLFLHMNDTSTFCVECDIVLVSLAGVAFAIMLCRILIPRFQLFFF